MRKTTWSGDVADRSRQVLLRSAAATSVVGLVAVSIGSQVQADSDAWLIAVDTVVGLAFVTAAAVAPGPTLERLLMASVGVLWLVGSVLPAMRLWHQTALVVALLAFPSGRPRGVIRWLVVAAALPIAFGNVPQAGIGAVFAAVALVTSRDGTAGRYPTFSAAGVALMMVGSWWTSRAFGSDVDPVTALVVYEIVLLLVATAFVPASADVMAARARLADVLLEDDVPGGLAGLGLVVREVLRDPSVRIHSGDDLVDVSGKVLDVTDGERVAVVEYSTPALDDPAVAESVISAVRMAARRERLEADQRAQLLRLQDARARLLTATDNQRAIMARQLLDGVVAPLRTAIATIESRRREAEARETTESIDIVVQELTAAGDEVMGLVAGIPPVPLGGGRLIAAIEALARRSPVPVTVSATPMASDIDTETALFYVASEALANSVKHAMSQSVSIALTADDRQIVLRIADDGRGGADLSGAGLQGLVDRVAARGGRLRVESPPGDGTTIIATIPQPRSAATARSASPPAPIHHHW
jgi:signal transduction histidine kinase